VDDVPTPGWPDPLCRIPRDLRGGHRSIRDLLIAAAPDLTDDHFVIDLVRMRLGDDPSLVDDWQIYSYDKRSSPSPYLDGTEVGFFDREKKNRRTYRHPADACAQFIFAEAAWVLEPCDCLADAHEYVGEAASVRIQRLRPLDKDPRESGPKEKYLCPICGERWVADFPYYHWADDGRGVRYLRRYETMLHGRPLNGLP
jgi:hypothetical protein